MADPVIVTLNSDNSIGVRLEDEGGVVSRYVLTPGHYDGGGLWIETDLSGEPKEAIDLATESWTPAVLTAWVQAHPWVAPAAATGEQVDLEREERISLPLAVQVPSLGAAIRINMDEKAQRNVQGLATVGLWYLSVDPTHVEDFRDYDNVMRKLAPGDMIAVGLQASARIKAMYVKSWALKAMDPIPADYREDKYW